MIAPSKEAARQLAAKLIPHTTSVENVDLIAEAFRIVFNEGVSAGIDQGEYGYKHKLKSTLPEKEGHSDTAYAEMVEFGDAPKPEERK